ncbi:hypothetical protein PIB30_011884 [Stylosanthes scabra]|uniref:Leucine-rich repeat-containing N-terminal plant-type domain-containing protein n=1 Tax=Stylosanthes scabra TaxID=79078 RepID=A0ABU6U5B2_9FABA|nr:hypothetical protein [Stylosanthes scabra]
MKIEAVLLFLVISIIHSTCLSHVISGLCLDDQRSLLLQFKNNLTFDPIGSMTLSSWNESNTSCCEWSGVTCDHHGHVTGLDLSDDGIEGALDNSSSLFSLQHLQRLNLADNYFNSSIPSKFNKLENLTYLNLASAGFVGQVPIEISQLARLVTLDLSTPNDDWVYSALVPQHQEKPDRGLLVGTFPQGIFQITTLSYIDISHNPYLHGSFPEFPRNGSLRTIRTAHTNFSGGLPLSIGNLVHLSSLDLSHCNFGGTLPSSFSKLTKLNEMDLSYNNFLGAIPSSAHFEGLQSLTKIHLSYNSITGSIPSSLFMIPSLKSVLLSHNKFSELEESTLVFSSRLEYLDVSCNNLSGSIPPFIFHLRGLSHLNLGNNKLSGPIYPSIIQLSGLTELDLSSNKFNFSWPMLLDALAPLRNLTVLDLSFNKIDDVKVTATDVALSTFPQLSFLNLASCNLKTFPGFLRYQFGLYDLNLSYNQIQGTIPNWIWRQYYLDNLDVSHNFLTNFEGPLHNLTLQLSTLYLQFNKLQGPMPDFLYYASTADYSSNNFNSLIPADIGHHMHGTIYLSLANNSFHGSIPHSLCNAARLLVLDLSHNKISGKIPHCLIKLGMTLAVLNLGSNNLIGHIPNAFPNSCALQTIVLNGNQLAGILPKSIEYCTALQILDVGRNQIVGAFPCFLCNISTLHVLILRNNKFHGPMGCPKNNNVWNMIQIVDVAFNNFSGELPVKWFSGWKKMISNDDGANSIQSLIQSYDGNLFQLYYQDSTTVTGKGQEMELVKILTIFTSIDFSYNQFEGPIPKELMDLKALYLLNLSHNALSGQIPSSIGNLSQLESLDLSKNSLEGEIPTELANLNFLSVLNLSFNHLTGRIPTGTQLQSFEASSFEGNDGLYGPPLTKTPNPLPPPPEVPPCGSLACEVHWDLVSAEVGLVFGLGSIIVPLLFWKRWRMRYCQFLDKTLCRIFPQLSHEYERRGGQTYRVLENSSKVPDRHVSRSNEIHMLHQHKRSTCDELEK